MSGWSSKDLTLTIPITIGSVPYQPPFLPSPVEPSAPPLCPPSYSEDIQPYPGVGKYNCWWNLFVLKRATAVLDSWKKLCACFSVVLVVIGLGTYRTSIAWPIRVKIVYFQALRYKTKAVILVICPTLQVIMVWLAWGIFKSVTLIGSQSFIIIIRW